MSDNDVVGFRVTLSLASTSKRWSATTGYVKTLDTASSTYSSITLRTGLRRSVPWLLHRRALLRESSDSRRIVPRLRLFSAVQLRVGRTPVGAPRAGGDQKVGPSLRPETPHAQYVRPTRHQVRSDQLRGQVVYPDAGYPRQQGLPPPGDRRYRRVPRPAAVRGTIVSSCEPL